MSEVEQKNQRKTNIYNS